MTRDDISKLADRLLSDDCSNVVVDEEIHQIDIRTIGDARVLHLFGDHSMDEHYKNMFIEMVIQYYRIPKLKDILD